jgi:hypothetical protein
VPGSLDKKGGRKRHLLLNKRWHLPPFLSNEPITGLSERLNLNPAEPNPKRVSVVFLSVKTTVNKLMV